MHANDSHVFAPSGQFAAFFAVMEQTHARKKWSFRWDHLLKHALGKSVYTLDSLHSYYDIISFFN